ncbi:ChbG/HpnK family deacetylase [Cupriavidus necator]|uniref:ChbG/HpnK family deacetylase n=1 Tax=Cupriavidus necator TaxID=106590 RepID=UPI003F73D465
MRNLIINADDFGYDEDTFKATVACFEAGLLTSATILIGRSASRLAYAFAREQRRAFSFGLHFNIVEGGPAHAARASSLCRRDGSFWPCGIQRKRALAGLLDEHDIRQEFRCQLTELRDHGVQVSHVDGHGHLHKYPAVIRVIKEEMLRAGIRWVRRPQNCYFTKVPQVRGLMNAYLTRHFSGLNYTDYYVGADPREPGWALRLPAILRDGVTEMSVHPGRAERWRQAEGAPLMSPYALGEALLRSGISLCRYGDL